MAATSRASTPAAAQQLEHRVGVALAQRRVEAHEPLGLERFGRGHLEHLAAQAVLERRLAVRDHAVLRGEPAAAEAHERRVHASADVPVMSPTTSRSSSLGWPAAVGHHTSRRGLTRSSSPSAAASSASRRVSASATARAALLRPSSARPTCSSMAISIESQSRRAAARSARSRAGAPAAALRVAAVPGRGVRAHGSAAQRTAIGDHQRPRVLRANQEAREPQRDPPCAGTP